MNFRHISCYKDTTSKSRLRTFLKKIFTASNYLHQLHTALSPGCNPHKRADKRKWNRVSEVFFTLIKLKRINKL